MPASAASPAHTDSRAASASPGRLLRPRAWLRARFAQWWQARLPLSDQLTLTQRNIYILPTGAGWMLALTLLVLLVAAINFQLNLGYLLTFLIAGSAVAGMHLCHATLRGLHLHLLPPAPQFLGAGVPLQVQLTNTRRSPRYAIALAVRNDDAPAWVWSDVPAQGSTQVQLTWRPTQRGRQRVPPIVLQTRFPLGTFRAWSYWRPAAQVLVYPQPESPATPLPTGASDADPHGARTVAKGTGQDEWDGVRAYRRGDTRKQIVWKKAAQALAAGSDALVSRDTVATPRQTLWLTPAQAGLPTLESRLSRLTAWVLEAERLGLRYGLRLPGVEIAPDLGPSHQRRCLEALALA